MTCPFIESGRCSLAEKHAYEELGLSLACRPAVETCDACLTSGMPRDDKPSIECLGLVNGHLAGDQLKGWRKYITWIVFGKSRGLGDTVAKITRATGIDRTVKAVAGKGCGCGERQKRWNAKAPYSDSQNSMESNSENLPGPSTVRAS